MKRENKYKPGVTSALDSYEFRTRVKSRRDPRLDPRLREIARKTRTPLVIYRDGKTVRYRIYNEDIS